MIRFNSEVRVNGIKLARCVRPSSTTKKSNDPVGLESTGLQGNLDVIPTITNDDANILARSESHSEEAIEKIAEKMEKIKAHIRRTRGGGRMDEKWWE